VRFGPPTLDPTEVCEVAGVNRDVGDALWRALGFPDVPEGVLAYTDEDARGLRLATEGLDRLVPAERDEALRVMLQEARVLSAHLAALADTELDALAALQTRGLRSRLIGEAVEGGLEGSNLGWLITYALRRQLDAVARRQAWTGVDAEGRGEQLAVAFVDLTDFTALSNRSELDAIGELLGRFESLAFDVVAEARGRVVKLIGDEVRVSTPSLTLTSIASDGTRLSSMRAWSASPRMSASSRRASVMRRTLSSLLTVLTPETRFAALAAANFSWKLPTVPRRVTVPLSAPT
jgi:adenylate cyclase